MFKFNFGPFLCDLCWILPISSTEIHWRRDQIVPEVSVLWVAGKKLNIYKSQFIGSWGQGNRALTCEYILIQNLRFYYNLDLNFSPQYYSSPLDDRPYEAAYT
jgi:hypothetical protein